MNICDICCDVLDDKEKFYKINDGESDKYYIFCFECYDKLDIKKEDIDE